MLLCPAADLVKMSVMRVFLGIDLPDIIDTQLSLTAGGLPGARWEPPEKLHLTLRFLDELDGGQVRRLTACMHKLNSPAFYLRLQGTGVFPPRKAPKSVWAGITPADPVHRLKQEVDRQLAPLGLPHDSRKFAPHITLARLKNAPTTKVAAFLAHHALLQSEPFLVDAVTLYSSVLAPGGSKYRKEAVFGLQPVPSAG